MPDEIPKIEIPPWAKRQLARYVLKKAREYFSNPDVWPEYEAWLVEYRAQQAEKAAKEAEANGTGGTAQV